MALAMAAIISSVGDQLILLVFGYPHDAELRK